MNVIKWIKRKFTGGKTIKNKTYTSENSFKTREVAIKEFKRAQEKLFKVELWSKISSLSSEFALYDPTGNKKEHDKVQLKDFIRIDLPGNILQNWVVVTHIKEGQNFSEFTVSPSVNPQKRKKGNKKIEHFFIDEATSTFRIERKGKLIKAYEIGRNEGINNQGKKAGKRKLINSLIAEGGWAGFQKFQWNKLTDYLCHKIEIN
ncbi:hypothetical protein JM83_1855 [Gillisia sp. Hel_I_86]|uniref:hypothetical protein n=1 Tax=Gillisia sp. Hel_I_86 TaxID=1249981 RepID=UPI00119C2225|nr:hypothetical protein [Gillisia sp. Hel_I_86]TVZ26864.1 hypothetical protein JM83_1855 [Gillisia sp. Hel_I_86]